ncbi:zinc-binding dehydrogenase [Streptomyces sp. VNUA24]|uniref:zinc-binding dehydrogenase n=1 Tax=Streptomyces sp. VNUA24 TaxID=3031131 RepID=UPI0023B81E57|nr:zinc-binding dehydrogenase [Streptomyces sp. VNUA24]WEH13091.1 zinc-binding dehydrogenase [Streptomyces sp. VNUA24]
MSTMTAARFHSGTGRFELAEVGIPEPGEGEVLVKVEACGICMSDVHLIQGMLPPMVPDVTPGHEAAGTVAAVGDRVPDRWKAGTRVALTAGRYCGACRACERGTGPDSCLEPQVMGLHYDGAWAEYVVVDSDQLAAIPDGLPFEQAAILADAVTTPYAALLDTAALRPSEGIGIWGLGGLGTHAVQIARMMGAAPIIAVDIDPATRERALKLGADVALDPAEDGFSERVLELTGGRGLEVAAEFVGLNAVRVQAVASLGYGGRAVLVGLTPEPIVLSDPIPFQTRMQSIQGQLGGRLRHLEELIKLVTLGRLDVSGSVTGTVALTDIHDGVRRLDRREGNPVRIVVTPPV